MSNINKLAEAAGITGTLINKIEALTNLFKNGKVGVEQKAVKVEGDETKKKFQVEIDGVARDISIGAVEAAAAELGFNLVKRAPTWELATDATHNA